MTVALNRGEWSAARPGHTLPPGKTQYPFYRRLGGPQDWCGWAENLVPTGIRSRIIQPIVSRYTDWATRPTQMYSTTEKYQQAKWCKMVRGVRPFRSSLQLAHVCMQTNMGKFNKYKNFLGNVTSVFTKGQKFVGGIQFNSFYNIFS